jgi:hypothetical protein
MYDAWGTPPPEGTLGRQEYDRWKQNLEAEANAAKETVLEDVKANKDQELLK